MAKKKPTEEEKEERTKRHLVELDKELYRKVGMIASALDMSIPAYINDRLKMLADEEYVRVLDAMGFAPKNGGKQ